MTDAERTLDEKILAIPGKDGFWKSRTATTFRDSAAVLIGRGLTEDAAVEFLAELYGAVAEEFGQ